jgi:hypothetical protein
MSTTDVSCTFYICPQVFDLFFPIEVSQVYLCFFLPRSTIPTAIFDLLFYGCDHVLSISRMCPEGML